MEVIWGVIICRSSIGVVIGVIIYGGSVGFKSGFSERMDELIPFLASVFESVTSFLWKLFALLARSRILKLAAAKHFVEDELVGFSGFVQIHLDPQP